jgi:hypothetical protein
MSCHILPIDSSNFYHDHNKYNVRKNKNFNQSSSYYTDEPGLSNFEDWDEQHDDDRKNKSSKKKQAN